MFLFFKRRDPARTGIIAVNLSIKIFTLKNVNIFIMNISTGDLLKNSFVLSIYGDRVDMLKKIFGYHKLICPKIFYGFKNPDIWKIFKDSKTPTRDGNAYKCSLGHASIVKAAKALELPYVLIFEDDTYPVDEINKKMDYYLSDIPKDASILLLGWSYTKTKPK